MTKFFYTDPLAAAWMNIKFGLQFVEPLPYEILQKPEQGKDQIYHIHPDSLHLLDTKEGDVLEDLTTVRENKRVSYQDGDSRGLCDSDKIIQRNGISFMWPEVESE